MSIGVIVFPGSNCDRDVQWATEGCLGMSTRRVWHEETDLSGFDAIVLPGVASVTATICVAVPLPASLQPCSR